MVFLAIIRAVIRFFKGLFGAIEREVFPVPTPVPALKIGDRVSFTDPVRGVILGTVTSVDTSIDPYAPYLVKFDGDETEVGTFEESELTVV